MPRRKPTPHDNHQQNPQDVVRIPAPRFVPGAPSADSDPIAVYRTAMRAFTEEFILSPRENFATGTLDILSILAAPLIAADKLDAYWRAHPDTRPESSEERQDAADRLGDAIQADVRALLEPDAGPLTDLFYAAWREATIDALLEMNPNPEDIHQMFSDPEWWDGLRKAASPHFSKHVIATLRPYLAQLRAVNPTLPIFAPAAAPLDSVIPAQLPPSPDPYANGAITAFASGLPALGANKAIHHARRGWPLAEDGTPHYLYESRGPVSGRFIYYITTQPERPVRDQDVAAIVDYDASTTKPTVADSQFAHSILQRYGPNVANLHHLLLTYIGQLDGLGRAVIPDTAVYRALGLDARTDLTRDQKDAICWDTINGLKALGVTIRHLQIRGRTANFSQDITMLWFMSTRQYGQMQAVDDHGTLIPKFQRWQLIVRPGEWAEPFLTNGPDSVRHIGYTTEAIFDVNRSYPWAVALAHHLNFMLRIQPTAQVKVAVHTILELDGTPMPGAEDRKLQHEYTERLIRASEQQRTWGWTPVYESWPTYLIPGGDADKADEIGDGSRAAPRSRRPRGYWRRLISLNILFRPPADLLAANLQTKGPALTPQSNTNKKLPAAQPQSTAATTFTGADVRRLREARDMTQAEFAAALGVARTTITMIEKGQRNVTPDVAAKLAAFTSQP